MPFLRNEFGQVIRKDGSVVEGAGRGRGPGVGKRTTVLADGKVSHLKVDKILGGAGPLREEYERLLEDPNTYLRHLAAWLKERGHTVNLAAIRIHRNRHIERFKHVRESAQSAAAFCEITRKQGAGGSFVEAAQGHFEMKLMEQMSDLARSGKLEPAQWEAYCKTLKGAVANRREVEQMRAEHDRRAAEAARAAEEAAKQGGSPGDVVDRVREILGLTEPGERLP